MIPGKDPVLNVLSSDLTQLVLDLLQQKYSFCMAASDAVLGPTCALAHRL